ncbi:hypothetical protein N9W89_06230 [Hellea sp.]|nr:hypothetical protein [Hellea sp.]
MDYFENLAKTLLEEEYHWVSQSVKVDVTKAEKREIGKHSIPRPEIDLLVYDFKNNRVIAVEVKSLLDSPGVNLGALQQSFEVPEGKYKLFTCDNYREIVFNRLHTQLLAGGFIQSSTKVQLGLVAGNIYKNQYDETAEYLRSRDWMYWGPMETKSRVEALAKKGYENNPYVMTAKVLMR